MVVKLSDGKTTINASDSIKSYYVNLKKELNKAYYTAVEARQKGYDPSLTVEIPFAEDVAGRVEKLVGPPRVAQNIRELSKRVKEREVLSIIISKEVAREVYSSTKDKEKALDLAVRTGLAILTEGVLVAPLEGIDRVKISRNPEGSEYADIFFSGPIRAAGGTAQAMSVLLTDVVRKELSVGRYSPTADEINRYIEEFQLYRNLQYRPTNEEIRFLIKHCPVCINGEGTEKEEVQGNRDLPRVPTNRVRSGACLVIAEGLLQKSSKLMKITKNLNLKEWEFLSELKKHKRKKEEKIEIDDIREELFEFELVEEGKDVNEGKSTKYISDLIMGRPVFSHPSRTGGFRLRYGRARCAGLAAVAVHPAVMVVLEEFIAVGTQIKTEKPGKAAVITPCDEIEGPYVLLKNGDYIQINSIEEANELRGSIEKIIDLGDILIPIGEFLENNQALSEGAYTQEEWTWEVREAKYLKKEGIDRSQSPYKKVLELPRKKKAFEEEEKEKLIKERGPPQNEREKKDFEEELEERAKKRLTEFSIYLNHQLTKLDAELLQISVPEVSSFDDAYEISKQLNVPLHPKYTLLWHDIDVEKMLFLRDHLIKNALFYDESLIIPYQKEVKDLLLTLGATHRERDGRLIISYLSKALYIPLGLKRNQGRLIESISLTEVRRKIKDPVEMASYLSGIKIMRKAPTRIGTRMGRPEKASMRKMKPPVHGLFPVGTEGGIQRLVQNSSEKSHAYVNISLRRCPKCNSKEIYLRCRKCGAITRPLKENIDGKNRRTNWLFNIEEEFERALKNLKLSEKNIPKVKGVKGLSSRDKIPERLEKAILRSLNSVYVFKDGTARYDMTDIPITHFKAKEIGTSINKLFEMGYTHDIYNKPLKDENQIIEIKPQDIIINVDGGEYLLHVAQFIDDELTKLYGLKPFYNAETPSDLIGHLVLGLAPHTSAGVLSRLIGYTQVKGCLAHPFFHASKRRNCDGDEDAVILLMDALINFSLSFLPEGKGGKMDAPLVVSMIIKPDEIDKEAHNIDVSGYYPLDFYYLTSLSPKLDNFQSYLAYRMDTVKSRLGTEKALEGFLFTKDTKDLNLAPVESSYKKLNSMDEKMALQFSLEKRIRAVDENDVAERILSTHLIPDIMGNIRSYGTQSFRCTKCQKTYRRLPLTGRCTNKIGKKVCGNPLILTVHEGNIKKYIKIMKELSTTYSIRGYTKERVKMHIDTLHSLFRYTNKKIKEKKGRRNPMSGVRNLEEFL